MNSSSSSGVPAGSTCKGFPGFQGFIGESPPMKELYHLLSRVGPSTAPVLLVGESGTGKELAARTLHRLSDRRHGPFVAVNCAAIPETLIEGELFGHERGAFTGATSRREGCFELADEGTLFLDELAAMPLLAQAKVLRALEEKSFRRLRGSEEVQVDVRIVVATNDHLDMAVRDGRLREDLLYRINVFRFDLPPLRERRSDVPLLAKYFIESFARQNDKGQLELSRDAENRLLLHPWPGNVRELRNAMERAVIMTDDSFIRPRDLPHSVQRSTPMDGIAASESRETEKPEWREEARSDDLSIRVGTSLDEAMRFLMLRTLESTNFNKTRTAEILGVSAKTVYNKLKDWSAEGDSRAVRADEVSRDGSSGPSTDDARRPSKKAHLVSIDDARRRRFG